MTLFWTALTNQSGKLEYPTTLRNDLQRDKLNSNNDVLLTTDFPDLELHASGKVRDIYRIDNDHLLFIATDRISAFDYVLATGIPQKGRVLTQLSLFWFDFLKDIVPNHLATADVRQYPQGTAEVRESAARTLHDGGARRHDHH